jgi:deoxyribodipyrimidine photo-lyase
VKTIIVWFRNDLRVHDHPALAAACEQADHVIPLFIFNHTLLHGRHGGSNRNRFLLESLQDLQSSLQSIGGDLVVRSGHAVDILSDLAMATGADEVFVTADYTPYALRRDKSAKEALDKTNVHLRTFPGRLIVSAIDKIATKGGTTHKVFTPFWRNWQQVERRQTADRPASITLPQDLELGVLPELTDITQAEDLSPDVQPGGETAGYQRLQEFLADGVHSYHDNNNDLGVHGTSRMSPYLHFGCVSPLEIEAQLSDDSEGSRAWHRQLAWRDFYNYILFKYPANAKQEFQERFRTLDWQYDDALLEAWQRGQTGYPIIDAAMRQLNREGWMHNRGRLIVGSFLTKDLGLDWRLGETYFMRRLMDGDEANNNGNWQWIASVGVDPAPVFRRLYNPATQQLRHDPKGIYVRRYVPELKDIPDKYIAEPWLMPLDVQQQSGCIIGIDYPAPVVDHAEARKLALERFRQASNEFNTINQ